MAESSSDRTIPPGVADEARRTIINKQTGETITWTKHSYETNGESIEAILVVKPGGGPPLHYHTSYTERFEVLKQPLGVNLNGKDLYLQPGESADVPIGSVHRFFNDTEEDITFKGYAIPGHAGFERSLYILFGLCNDGLSDPNTNLPISILHTAIVADMGDMRFPGYGGALLNYLMKGLAAVARWRGIEEELLKKYWD